MKWLLFLVLLSAPAWAADRPLSLSLDAARGLLAASGVNPGTIFPIGPQRYQIMRVEGRSKRPNVFDVEIEVRPMPKVNAAP